VNLTSNTQSGGSVFPFLTGTSLQTCPDCVAPPGDLCQPLPHDPLKRKYGTVSFLLRHELFLKVYSVSTLLLLPW